MNAWLHASPFPYSHPVCNDLFSLEILSRLQAIRGQGLSGFLLHPQDLAQRLALGRCSVDIWDMKLNG